MSKFGSAAFISGAGPYIVLPFHPHVEHLYIYGPPQWQGGVENMQWLEFFHLFSAVKNFYVCEEYVQYIADTLKGLVRERVTDVLPALESLFLEDLQSVEKVIGQFIAARRLLGLVAVSPWKGVLPESTQ